MEMLSEVEKKVADFISTNQILKASRGVLLAVSGGADSTALLHIMRSLQIEKIFDVPLHCAHINHSLRAAAKADEDFVASIVSRLGLPITIRKIDVRKFAAEQKLSIETAARELRIRALTDIAELNNCDVIATGHQKNDNAETVIHRLLRGTGFRGLAGIWPIREFNNKIRFVRPLLGIGRDEIIQYLSVKGLQWTEDATNADCVYTRNFVRHLLLPAMQKNSKASLVEQFGLLSKAAFGLQVKICRQVDQIWPKLAEQPGGKIILNATLFAEQPEPMKIEMIFRSLDAICCGQGNLNQIHYQRILQLSGKNAESRKIELPGGFIVRREYNSLIFSRQNATCVEKPVGERIELKIPGITQFGQYLIKAEIMEKQTQPMYVTRRFNAESLSDLAEHFDLDKLKLPLLVRHRQPGDRFVPFGQNQEKKIGKFLTDTKVPEEIRKKALVVSDTEKIIWLWPVRICEQARITGTTGKILKLRIINKA
jgi:tRNA(Ile)-lysidine synthase